MPGFVDCPLFVGLGRKGKRKKEDKIHHRDTEGTEADPKTEDGTGSKGSGLTEGRDIDLITTETAGDTERSILARLTSESLFEPYISVAFVIFCKKYVRLRDLCVSVVNFVLFAPFRGLTSL
jgi:hypothetical protein